MRTYRIASVRKNREGGRENVFFADLLNDEGITVISGTLGDVVRVCEERGYYVTNMEQAKTVLNKQ